MRRFRFLFLADLLSRTLGPDLGGAGGEDEVGGGIVGGDSFVFSVMVGGVDGRSKSCFTALDFRTFGCGVSGAVLVFSARCLLRTERAVGLPVFLEVLAETFALLVALDLFCFEFFFGVEFCVAFVGMLAEACWGLVVALPIT